MQILLNSLNRVGNLNDELFGDVKRKPIVRNMRLGTFWHRPEYVTTPANAPLKLKKLTRHTLGDGGYFRFRQSL